MVTINNFFISIIEISFFKIIHICYHPLPWTQRIRHTPQHIFSFIHMVVAVIFISCSGIALVSAVEDEWPFNGRGRPVTVMDDLIKAKENAVMFLHESLHNYSLLLEASKYGLIYAVASESTLVAISKKTFEQKGDTSTLPSTVAHYPQICGDTKSQNSCYDRNIINLLTTTQEGSFIWYCYLSEIHSLNTLVQRRPACVLFFPTKSSVTSGNDVPGYIPQFTSMDPNQFPVLLHSNNEDFIYLATVPKRGRSIMRIPPPNIRPYTEEQKRSSLRSSVSESSEFVGAFETQDQVFFLLHEESKETRLLCNRLEQRVTMLGRVCKGDTGPLPEIVGDSHFGTLRWAELQCPSARHGNLQSSSSPYIYPEVLHSAWLPDDQLLITLFHSNRNGPKGVAVCVYSLYHINAAFRGPIREEVTVHTEKFPSSQTNYFPNMCAEFSAKNLSVSQQTERKFSVQKFPYAAQPVYPLNNAALLTGDIFSSSLWRYVVAHQVTNQVNVFYLATERWLHRYVLYTTSVQGSSTSDGAPQIRQHCEIERILVINPHTSYAKRITLLKLEEGAQPKYLYIGTEDRLIRLSLYRCNQFKSRSQCLAASDPYCGWSTLHNRCLPPPDRRTGGEVNLPLESLVTWKQELNQCPQLSTLSLSDLEVNKYSQMQQKTNFLPQSSKEGAWSDWSVCSYRNSSIMGPCLCRVCQQSAPSCGEDAPKGTVQVANCTVHGGWTPWSSWSSCSHTCGTGSQTRYRICDNPRPRYGGKPCMPENHLSLGDSPHNNDRFLENLPDSSKETRSCVLNSRCPEDPSQSSWSAWQEWESCDAKCGAGYQKRTRKCQPQPGLCTGPVTEWQECTGRDCPVVQSFTTWTDWSSVSNFAQKDVSGLAKTTNDVAAASLVNNVMSPSHPQQQMRFRFGCSIYVNVANSQSIRPQPNIESISAQERDCTAVNACSVPRDVTRAGGWGEWSDWTPCSVQCGGGHQDRERACTNPQPLGDEQWSAAALSRECPGHSRERQACNTQPCQVTGSASWGCWSEWSQCSVTCGTGHRTRTRTCTAGNLRLCGGDESDTKETQLCHAPIDCPDNADSYWDFWTDWSSCSTEEPVRKRTRRCRAPRMEFCRGGTVSLMSCAPLENDGINNAGITMSSMQFSGLHLVLAGLLGLLCGAVLAVILCFFHWRRKQTRQSKRRRKMQSLLASQEINTTSLLPPRPPALGAALSSMLGSPTPLLHDHHSHSTDFTEMTPMSTSWNFGSMKRQPTNGGNTLSDTANYNDCIGALPQTQMPYFNTSPSMDYSHFISP